LRLPLFTQRTSDGRSDAPPAAFGRAAVEYTLIAFFGIVAVAMTIAWIGLLGFLIFKAAEWALG
jgi:hypothetical protein